MDLRYQNQSFRLDETTYKIIKTLRWKLGKSYNLLFLDMLSEYCKEHNYSIDLDNHGNSKFKETHDEDTYRYAKFLHKENGVLRDSIIECERNVIDMTDKIQAMQSEIAILKDGLARCEYEIKNLKNSNFNNYYYHSDPFNLVTC